MGANWDEPDLRDQLENAEALLKYLAEELVDYGKEIVGTDHWRETADELLEAFRSDLPG